jgi:hypothetical protein
LSSDLVASAGTAPGIRDARPARLASRIDTDDLARVLFMCGAAQPATGPLAQVLRVAMNPNFLLE